MWKDFFKNPIAVVVSVILVTLVIFLITFMFFSHEETSKQKTMEDKIAEMQFDVKIPTGKKK